MEKITNKYVVIERSMSDTEDGTVWIADTWADSRAIRDAIKARGNGYVTNMGESHDLTPRYWRKDGAPSNLALAMALDRLEAENRQ